MYRNKTKYVYSMCKHFQYIVKALKGNNCRNTNHNNKIKKIEYLITFPCLFVLWSDVYHKEFMKS